MLGQRFANRIAVGSHDPFRKGAALPGLYLGATGGCQKRDANDTKRQKPQGSSSGKSDSGLHAMGRLGFSGP